MFPIKKIFNLSQYNIKTILPLLMGNSQQSYFSNSSTVSLKEVGDHDSSQFPIISHLANLR